MENIIHGGCLCGSVRYEYNGPLGDSSYCHCDDCKRSTGGPYTVGILSKYSKLTVNGKVKEYTVTADSGRKITRDFCPQCGSPLFTRAEKYPDHVFIKAGSLDEPQLVKPCKEIWTERAVDWAYIDKNLPTYPKGSPPLKE